ncbi:hypothetical protein A4V01_22185 [Erysipelotrichaceae bacterium I46]|nr:hypothetical protein A4V01_22185 [Erysipelotrichaceae bacterium I46]ASU17231.1 hypothetical protein ADH65_01245 [[Clostridium] innocuum]
MFPARAILKQKPCDDNVHREGCFSKKILSYFRLFEKGRLQLLLINTIVLISPCLSLPAIEKETSKRRIPFLYRL